MTDPVQRLNEWILSRPLPNDPWCGASKLRTRFRWYEHWNVCSWCCRGPGHRGPHVSGGLRVWWRDRGYRTLNEARTAMLARVRG
jgi:hypothetical protein